MAQYFWLIFFQYFISTVGSEHEVGEYLHLGSTPDISWLNKNWIENVETLQQIENALCTGRVVQIKNALNQQVAEKLAHELDQSSKWEQYSSSEDSFKPLPRFIFKDLDHSHICENVQENIVKYKKSNHKDTDLIGNNPESMGYYYPSHHSAPIYLKTNIYQHKMNAIHNQSHHSPTMASLKQLFSSSIMIQLFSKLSRSRLTKHNLNPTWYQPGDHITIHNDKVKNRRVSYILHLGINNNRQCSQCVNDIDVSTCTTNTNNNDQGWDVNDGGNLVWCDPAQVLIPTFNSLTIFSVSSRSYHFVEPVWFPFSNFSTNQHIENDREMSYHLIDNGDNIAQDRNIIEHTGRKRLAVSGFYFADEKEVNNWNLFAISLPYPLEAALFIE